MSPRALDRTEERGTRLGEETNEARSNHHIDLFCLHMQGSTFLFNMTQTKGEVCWEEKEEGEINTSALTYTKLSQQKLSTKPEKLETTQPNESQLSTATAANPVISPRVCDDHGLCGLFNHIVQSLS